MKSGIYLLFEKVVSWFGGASALANFCTIILFMIFVVGKIWILIRNKSLYVENFNYSIADESEEFNKQFLLGGQEVIEISSPDGIYDLNVYTIEKWGRRYSKVKKRTLVDKKCEDNIQHPLKLNKNEKVYIRTDLPCGPALYQIEIIKYDYTRFTAALGYNGKVGGVVMINAKTHYGLKSLLYYLCM